MDITINIFISHSWSYSNHYERLYSWICYGRWSVNNRQDRLIFLDWSVPRDDPIHNARSERELKERIYEQINEADVVIIPTGMYASYSRWIQKEIEGATYFGVPILAVNPWGQQRNSSTVETAAIKSVGWQSQSVANGIWELYCHG